MLPQQFTDRMEQMLKEEYPDFLASYERGQYHSLRVNLLKGTKAQLEEKTSFLLKPVSWAENGFYYKEEDRPGRHPFHEAGVYYIQEASAMAPAVYLNAQPGERILDLCAAPGGKSTQIADAMQGKGLLVSNEINSARGRILSENIERMGIRNALAVSHEPAFLAERFPEYFDRVLVDAPCSGEGMFRKNEEAANEWSYENVLMCAERQEEILECAAVMLRPGGRMVYSTCTFSMEENEGMISRFLEKHPEFEIEERKKFPGMSPGMPPLEKGIRLWPHRSEGEGHFLACLKKAGQQQMRAESLYGEEKGISPKDCKEWLAFKERYIKTNLEGVYFKFGDQLYLLPEGAPSLKGLKVLRGGLHLGTFKKNRFEPSHALALSLKPEEAARCFELSINKAAEYISGNIFTTEGEKGWYLITTEGYSLGWGKLAGNIMKNHYPKGLRK